jgi:hypothetical protein
MFLLHVRLANRPNEPTFSEQMFSPDTWNSIVLVAHDSEKGSIVGEYAVKSVNTISPPLATKDITAIYSRIKKNALEYSND